jgi:hypothetical protein
MMVTGSITDYLFGFLVIALFVTIIGCAFWPIHRHRYNKLIAEHWNTEGHHYKLLQCVCGKKRELFIPLEDSNETV